ncbi:cytochrome b561 [Diplodia corticola]|uniref:Cytochrome b561 n=1 Tax=Diplodia corticola TaxID=236234 RepID=A0A1J9SBU9_9PEZI|nr:cytochrome b561 [Diplodia corticola]OJD37061.1 cytochrome b561 [Diplodia corticola]
MASATGIPEQHPDPVSNGHGEQEPLLGRPGDASQKEGKPLAWNLVLGTGVIAQAGIWILTAIVWAGILSHDVILFSAHPLLNSAGLLLITQAALILQPTHTPDQKRRGTYVHAVLNHVGVLALLAGLIVIEVNKERGGLDHFESPHAILGIITYIFLVLQVIVGFTQFFTPEVYRGVDRAKKIYKYHRFFGYVTFVLTLVTIAAATRTTFNVNVLHIKTWAVIVASLIVLAGIVPRIKRQKLGL